MPHPPSRALCLLSLALCASCGGRPAAGPGSETPSNEIDLTRPAPRHAGFPEGLVPCPKDAPEGSSCTKGAAPGPAPSARPASPPSDASTVWKVPVGPDDPVDGAQDALVTVVVFSDFECPFCRKAAGHLDRVREDFPRDVRLVWKDCPLPMHAWAEPAAEFARAIRAAKGDAGFWKAHAMLYAAQDELGEPLFRNIAEKLGVEWGPVRAAMRSARYGAAIQAGIRLSDRVDVTATPTTYVNGKRLVGAQGYDTLKELIASELAHAKDLVAGGGARSGLYDRLISAGMEVAPPSDVPAP